MGYDREFRPFTSSGSPSVHAQSGTVRRVVAAPLCALLSSPVVASTFSVRAPIPPCSWVRMTVVAATRGILCTQLQKTTKSIQPRMRTQYRHISLSHLAFNVPLAFFFFLYCCVLSSISLRVCPSVCRYYTTPTRQRLNLSMQPMLPLS